MDEKSLQRQPHGIAMGERVKVVVGPMGVIRCGLAVCMGLSARVTC